MKMNEKSKIRTSILAWYDILAFKRIVTNQLFLLLSHARNAFNSHRSELPFKLGV